MATGARARSGDGPRCKGMTVFDARSIPDEVHSSTKDPEIAEWLKTGPVLGAHKPVHLQRREHDAFITRPRRGLPTVAR